MTISPEVGWVAADPIQLELAVVNLALNARDAMPEGGELTLSAAPESDGQTVLIAVSDTGIGMTEDVAARAFEPFFTTKDRGKGTGLGLSQIYGFAQQCRGSVKIRSAPGRGTTVELRLPVSPPGRDIANKPVAEPAAPPAPGRLLVVDDDDRVRAVVVEALRSAGHDVTQAASGEAALAALDGSRPSAALLDFIMPGMNGAELAQELRHRIPGLPIAFS